MASEWLVVGIAGATCSGKTTLAKRLAENLENSIILNQDEYFLPLDDPRHTRVPELNHLNFELLTSLDMTKMISDIVNIFETSACSDGSAPNGKTKVLLLDGFLLFDCNEIVKICDLRYFLDAHENDCRERRKLRIYEPPDVPNYFDRIVWPEYVKSRTEILANKELSDGITFIDASSSREATFNRVLDDIRKRLSM